MYHINYLELLPIFLALKCFTFYNARVCLKTDNTTVVAYINKMGGMGRPCLMPWQEKFGFGALHEIFRYCCAYSWPEKHTRGLLFSEF